MVSLSPWIVTAARVDSGRPAFVYGLAYPAFSAYVLLSFTFAMYFLFRKVQAATGLRKLQLRYLLLGILLGGAGVIVTNLLIPLLWNTSRFSVLGPYFSLLMVSFSAHAIIRHRLLDITIVVRRGVVYIISAAVAGSIFAAALWSLAGITSSQLQGAPLFLQVLLALALALAFQPLAKWTQAKLDHYVYRETYSYQTIIRDASDRIGATLDIESLSAYLCNVVSRTLRPESVGIFLPAGDSQEFTLVRQQVGLLRDSDASPQLIPASSPLITFLARCHQPLLSDDTVTPSADGEARAAVQSLLALGGAMALPMTSERRLIGLVLVGPKLSGDTYFADDIHLLTTLANHAAIAAQNATLYRQVVTANEYIHNILTTMDSGVISVDAAGLVIMANAAAVTLTNSSDAALSRSSLSDLPSALASQLAETLHDGHARPQIETSLAASGRATPIVCSTSALRDHRGHISGALIVFNDLSKLKALEMEKRRVERLASVGALAAGIAHEIKNPLVAIRTFAELLPERFSEVDFREDFSRVAVSEIDRIDSLVARLHGLAASPPTLTTRIDLREPLNDTITLLRAQLDHAGIQVRRVFADPAPWVVGDSSQLKQLFLNLLQNAIEAIGQTGEIDVRVSRRRSSGSERVVIEISDTGPGIPDSIRASVFNPFFTTKITGSGLGLAICRGIADAHRAHIKVEARTSGHGTVVTIDFPAPADASHMLAEQLMFTP